MEEIYKDVNISYEEFRSYFKFEIENTILMTSTLYYAKRTIDNYLMSKTLVGRKVIGFNVRDGKKIVSEIARLSFDDPIGVHSGDIAISYVDNENNKLPTTGPFMEYNKENEDIADQITYARMAIRDNYKKIEKLNHEVDMRRIDKIQL